MISLPFDIDGPSADQLRAVLAGQADYFSAPVIWNGTTLTFVVVLEGYDPAAPPERKSDLSTTTRLGSSRGGRVRPYARKS
jgi:hypothetical protein